MTFNDLAWWSQVVWRVVLLLVVIALSFKMITDWSWFKQILCDESGKPSSSRISALAVTWIFCFSYMKIVIASVTADVKEMPDVPTNWVFILGSLLAIQHAGKLVLKRLTGGNNAGTEPKQ